MNRTLVIGDIHGAYKGLIQVLERASVDFHNDKLIFLGDYVDGWSESAEVVEFLIDLKNKSTHKPIFIKGNHDEWCREWLCKDIVAKPWIVQGGNQTVESYLDTGFCEKESHKQFFTDLLNFYIDENNNGFVHGGFTSKKGLGKDLIEKNYYWDRSLVKNTIEDYIQKKPLDIRLSHQKEIFVGHSSTINIAKTYPAKDWDGRTPMRVGNLWNIDTGAGYDGKLTILDVKTKKYWQSDCIRGLYTR